MAAMRNGSRRFPILACFMDMLTDLLTLTACSLLLVEFSCLGTDTETCVISFVPSPASTLNVHKLDFR